jgi:ABC-2 type transport system ATP-binding protein
MEYCVRATSLTKRFGDLYAVDDMNLELRFGEIYGLLGPNGAGKTTVIKILCGVLAPTSGEVYVLARKMPDRGISRLIGYMPQDTALYAGLTVRQNIKFFGEIYKLTKDAIKRREADLLRLIDLERFADELVSNLSGGMKHRVSLACALLQEPQLLLLDEPTVGVDPELRVSFWDHFSSLKENGTTVLISTHYMDEARRCDRIGFMKEGRLIAEDVPDELLQRTATDSLEDAFLEFARVEGGA